MIKTVRKLSGVFGVALLAACQSGAPGPVATAPTTPRAPPDRSEDPTTADGIFTIAQAERGLQLFEGICSECHDAGDWTDPGFRGRWKDQSVFQLWYYINDRMPYDDPWSLNRQQVTDVLTYILQLNRLPAGDAELATDDDSIDDYWITWERTR